MLKTTMKFRIIILFFLSLTLDGFAQRCGGHFNFRIYDQNSKVLTPSLADTIFYASENLNKKKLTNEVNIKNIDGSYGIGFTSLNSSTSLFFNFATGCHLPIKTVSIEKNNQKMILSFCNIEPEWEFVMDSIPFRPGVWKYDISKIVDSLKLNQNEGKNQYKIWGYIIPFNLIQAALLPPLRNEYKNDTLYYYADTLKTKLISKGKVKIQKTTVIYYHNAWEMKLNDNLKRKEKRKSITYLKKGTWTYDFGCYSLQRKENEKRKRKQKIYSRIR